MTDAREPLITLKGVRKHYHMGENVIKALDGVDLDIFPGEFVTIVGASGSGKSTLLHVLGCLDAVSDGSYMMANHDLSGATDENLSQIRNGRLGFVFQQFNLLGDLSVLENIALPLAYAGLEKEDRQRIAAKHATDVGLGDRLDHHPNELSGGQAQRVAIARALVNEPDIIMADEPTGALDSKTGKEIMNLLQDLSAKGKTIIMVTHDKDLSEKGTRKISIADGKIIGDEPGELADEDRKQPSVVEKDLPEPGLGMWDLLRIGITEGVLAHKMRTGLTMLGVIIGVASVIVMSSFSEGSKQKQADQIRALGAGLIRIVDKQFENENLIESRVKGSPGLTISQAESLAKNIPGVERVATARNIKLKVLYERGELNPRILGIGGDYLTVNNLRVATGRFIDEGDQRRSMRVVVVGSKIAKEMGKDSVIDEILILGGQPYRVVGVLASKNVDTKDLEASGVNDPNLDILVPLNTILTRTKFLDLRNELDEILIQLAHEDQLYQAGIAIRHFLDAAHFGVKDYDIVIPLNLLKAKQDSQKLLDILTLCICAISLVVGGIGIMNIMLASVTERLREIGIRRAVGATKFDIRRQFLSEAIFISAIGGFIGVFLSIVCVVISCILLDLPIVFSPVIIIIAVGAATLTGLGFGYYPAAQAADQNLVEVLRNE